MKVSTKGLDFIKRHEGCRLIAYDDLQPNVVNPDPVKGTLTIGYGHTKGVYKGMTITEDQAEELLRQDLKVSERAVQSVFEYYGWAFKQSEFDALVSWVFNTGSGNLKNRNLIKAIDRLKQAEMTVEAVWNRHYITSKGIKLAGLIARRKDETNFFFN